MHRQLISNQPLKDDLEDLDQIDFFQNKEKQAPLLNNDNHTAKPEKSPAKSEKEQESPKEHKEPVHHDHESNAAKKTTTKRYQHLQVIDEDTEHFKTKLDGLINSFRTETLNEFMSIKRSLLEDQTNAIDGETRKYGKLLENRTNELDKTKEALAKKIKELERAELITHVVSEWAGTARTKRRNVLLLSKCFNSFKANRDSQETKKKNNRLVDALHSQKTITRVFGAWRRIHMNLKEERTKQAFDDILNRELGDLSAKYDKEIEILTSKLNETLKSLAEAEQNKEEIQENLKKAFMRGVCALNFEAMSILNTKDQEESVLEPSGLRKRGGSFSQQDNPFSESLTEGKNLEENYKVDEVPHNVSPKKNIVFNQSAKVESKETKWKDAPIVGSSQNSGKKPLKENILRQSAHVEKQDNKENVAHNYSGLADHSTMSNQSHNDEGRVIKVSQGKSYGMGIPSLSVAAGKQVKSQEKPITMNANKAAQLRTQLAKGKK